MQPGTQLIWEVALCFLGPGLGLGDNLKPEGTKPKNERETYSQGPLGNFPPAGLGSGLGPSMPWPLELSGHGPRDRLSMACGCRWRPGLQLEKGLLVFMKQLRVRDQLLGKLQTRGTYKSTSLQQSCLHFPMI